MDTQKTLDSSVSDTSQEHDNLYTPAMLAEILDVSVRVVRRWHRAGLLSPVKEVLGLPYFDFGALTTARQLAKWVRQGATVQSIQQQLDLLRSRAAAAGVAADLNPAELPIAAEGKRLVLRAGDRFVEASGQFRFGFDQAPDEEASGESVRFVLPLAGAAGQSHRQGDRQATPAMPGSLEQMVEAAIAAEDDEELEIAVDWYRAALAAYGPNPDICFQLAELLYRLGDAPAARERYYMALELDSKLVEARANLGCVLAELGQLELAVAAFEGTLEQFDDYADVHFHLARALDELGHAGRAAEHWRRFLELAPASPWAEEAQQRLSLTAPLFEL